MKRKWCFKVLIIIIILIPIFSYAEGSTNTENIIQEQESNFKIKDFLNESKNYLPDYIKDLDLSKIFNEATTGKIDNKSFIEKIPNLLGSEITDTLKILINILVIVLIHSLLKAITDSLESTNVSTIVYYVQYILIVTIIMASFSKILGNVKETIENLVGFSGVLVPLLITLMTFTRKHSNNHSYRTYIIIFNRIFIKITFHTLVF